MPYPGRRLTTGGKCRPSFPAFRPTAGRRCLLVLAVGFHGLGVALLRVLAGMVVHHCAASAAPQKRMAAGHPFMGRGSRLDRGNPGGVPRPQAALRRFVLRRWSSYPRFWALQLLVFKYLKKTICSKLLVGPVENPKKLVVARVCGLWKSRTRDRLHATAGQITR